jgi:hypothetical protein
MVPRLKLKLWKTCGISWFGSQAFIVFSRVAARTAEEKAIFGGLFVLPIEKRRNVL